MLFESILLGCIHLLLIFDFKSLKISFVWVIMALGPLTMKWVCAPNFVSLCRHVRTFTHASGLWNFQIRIPPLLCTSMQLMKKNMNVIEEIQRACSQIITFSHFVPRLVNHSSEDQIFFG